MQVAADVAVSDEAIECAVASTGMRAALLSAPACAVALLFKVEGLDCKNEVATLKRELGPLAGEAWLSFDTSKRLMTVAPQSRTSAGEIAARVASTGVRATLWPDGSAEPLLFLGSWPRLPERSRISDQCGRSDRWRGSPCL